jgi:hypothetical protein
MTDTTSLQLNARSTSEEIRRQQAAEKLRISGEIGGSIPPGLNDHHLKGGGLTLRLKVACLRLKPLEIFPAESRLKARSAL